MHEYCLCLFDHSLTLRSVISSSFNPQDNIKYLTTLRGLLFICDKLVKNVKTCLHPAETLHIRLATING